MDKSTEELFEKLYFRFEMEKEYSIYSPEFSQEQTDALIHEGYLNKIDASSLSGWKYILRPTYSGQTYFIEKKNARNVKFKHNIIEIVKFLILTIISIIVLMVSILK